MTMLNLTDHRPWLTLWSRRTPTARVVRHDARTDVAAYTLVCPRCRRVFNVTDEQPLQLRSIRQVQAAEASTITIPGEVVCPFDCGARFSVWNGRIRWLKVGDHRVA
jgi:hypothetical protein